MKLFLYQLKKEISAYFYGINAYIILGAYAILSLFSALYLGNYFVREIDVMNAFFTTQPFILILIIPAITMRLWADEIKSGTIEILLTQPIGYFTLTFAKFAAGFIFFILAITFSLPLLIVSNIYSITDVGITLSAYTGLLLCAALFTAIGCFVSLLCRNNIISYMVTIFILFAFAQFTFAPIGGENLYIPLDIMNLSNNYDAFIAGLVTWGNVAYFVIGTILFLWMNTFFLTCRLFNNQQKEKTIFVFLALLIFFISVSCLQLFCSIPHDFTETQRYTLLQENRAYLQNLDKRINITLYEAQAKREDLNSNYAVHAHYIERLLKQIELLSSGNVRYEIIQVESLSPLERRLIQENIPYEEDNVGNKIYMLADISDNEGNNLRINAFPTLRQNLVETDIIRTLKLLGKEKKNIAVIALAEDLEHMQSFNNTLNEFYRVKYLTNNIFYLPPAYDAVVVVNPVYPSTQLLLALEQYILNGGSIIFFHEPRLLKQGYNHSIIKFLNTFGIEPEIEEGFEIKDRNLVIANVYKKNGYPCFDNIIMQETDEVTTRSSEIHKTKPLLSVDSKVFAYSSWGKYMTNYPDLTEQSDNIISFSRKDGKIYFIYDSNLIMDYLYSSDLSKGHGFYQIVPTTDNMLFMLNLLDSATNSEFEKTAVYRQTKINQTSIGLVILDSIRQRYNSEISNLTQQLDGYHQKSKNFTETIKNNGFSSIRQIGNINNITQKIDKITDELNNIQKTIQTKYEHKTAGLTALLMLAIPFIMLALLWIILWSIQKCRLSKIRRLTNDE